MEADRLRQLKYIPLILFLSIQIVPSMAQQKRNIEVGVLHNILFKVFLIQYDNQFGSCFGVSIDKKDYLITARHLFPAVPNAKKIKINLVRNRELEPHEATILLHSNEKIDVAVLSLGTSTFGPNEFGIEGDFAISEDCYFLGFPFGMTAYLDSTFNNSYPQAVVKKAIVSSSTLPTSPEGFVLFLDGMNNSGFSGGPVVVKNNNGNPFNSVIGIVSGYIFDQTKVINIDGKQYPTQENAGIIRAYHIRYVTEILEQNTKK